MSKYFEPLTFVGIEVFINGFDREIDYREEISNSEFWMLLLPDLIANELICPYLLENEEEIGARIIYLFVFRPLELIILDGAGFN